MVNTKIPKTSPLNLTCLWLLRDSSLNDHQYEKKRHGRKEPFWIKIYLTRNECSDFCDYLSAKKSVRLTVPLLCIHHAFLHHLQHKTKNNFLGIQ